MDNYKVIYLPDEDTGIYGVSVVDDPANSMVGVLPNNMMFVTLSKEQKVEDVILSNEGEKRLMTGVVLIPNQKILRYNKEENKPFNLIFGEEEIRLLSQDFMKNNNHKNSTINHNKDMWLTGITFVESWIIEDPNNDKSNALGFRKLPKGTWMMSAYIENDELWSSIKNGDFKGFSIDSYIAFEKIDMASVIPNNPDSQSENDNDILITRYRYSPLSVSENSRDFCIKMVNANNLYRKEDIMVANSNIVNPGFGHNGESYDLFKYKGGVYCKHRFVREIYLRKNNKKGVSLFDALQYIKGLTKEQANKVKFDINPDEVGQIANSSNNYWRYGDLSNMCNCQLSSEEVPNEVIDNLISKGVSKMGDEWVLIHTSEVTDENLKQEFNGEEIIQTINKQKQINMSVLQKLIKMFSEESVSLMTIEIPELGKLTADAFEVDNIVFQDVEGEMKPLANTTFVYEDYTYTTDENGKITEKMEVVEEPTMEEETEDLMEEKTEDVVEEPSELDKLKEELDNLKKQLEIITKEKDSVLMENQELKKQPKETRLKANLSNVPSHKESTMEVLARIAKNNK